MQNWDFRSCPVVKKLCFHCNGNGLSPGWGTILGSQMSQNSAKLKCMAELLHVVCYMPMTIHFITGNCNLSITSFIFILCFTLYTCSYNFFLSLITNFFFILDISISLKACLVFAICNKYPPLNHYCSQLLFCFSVPHKSKILEWVTSSCLRFLISYLFNSSTMFSSLSPLRNILL